MENTAQQCRLGLFQDSDFAGDLEDIDFRRNVMYFRQSHGCSHKLDVQEADLSPSYSSTESEMISLDADLSILDPKIQFKFVDTMNQLAAILTKDNFTRDEWYHLLCLINISKFSSSRCDQAMSRRITGRNTRRKNCGQIKAWQGLQQRRVRVHLQAQESLRAASHCLSLIASTERPVAEDSNEK